MNVCENIGEHMIGNVYVKFVREEDAEKCVKDLENRWYVLHTFSSTFLLFIRCCGSENKLYHTLFAGFGFHAE